MKKVKVGFISFAHMHAASYLFGMLKRDDVEVIGIADEDAERVRPYSVDRGIPYYADYNELLAQELDAVVICSENARHAEITKRAAAAGKHVLCEKPLGLSEAEMLEMIQACKDNGVQLMTAFPCRYISSVRQAKEAIDAGQIGDILAMKGTNRGTMPGGWFIEREKSGGGAVLDHTVHVMDLMHWFTGSKAEEVYAHAETLFNDTEIDDAGMVHVKFANGVVAVLDPSWSRNRTFPTWGDVTLEIIGTKGVLNIDSFAQKNDVYSDVTGKASWSFWGDDMDEGLVNSFVESIRDGKPVEITGEDGYLSARVAIAAYESASTKRTVQLKPQG
ncbi:MULTISPECIES: Gfo/Idh/MocA family oxidoreductase [Paenibacillus]|uniref:Gfo/Idh/MocA family protein n=1 Tax=Paenibacillus TaxID=44249 RepID=UPI00178791A1|nr:MULTISPECIES: Gfo/Idh/MocA family oxidoreductase [Paenibacillus]QOT08681.1 Gfo/Idh/MocA family oxidoreductase [Paenibacillus sp. JNUCC-32]WFB59378.1 Gfo/Idh/MocA family oxidoreductase [Paenibacillus sp. BR1-192]GIP06106.1 dehydrogenase [Paenibacillus lautus]